MDRTIKCWICVLLCVALCIGIVGCSILSRDTEPAFENEDDETTDKNKEPEETTDSSKPDSSKPADPDETTKGSEDDPTDPSTEDPEKTPVDVSFFDDAAFIGDSVTLMLQRYHMKTGALSKTTFLCIGSYSVNNAVTGQLLLSYQGQDMTPQDALAACGAKKVFILLGMNDIALFGEDSIAYAMDNWATLIANIREKNPDIEIYIQSGTPIYTDGQKGGLNNDRMDAYNVALEAFAAENDCYYIDIATPLKDDTNGLKEEYCSDAYVHFTEAACQKWIELLLEYLNA